MNKTSNFSQVTAIIFDMDGTLIKHTWQLSQITETLFARFADDLAPITHDKFYEVFWPKNEDLWYMVVDRVLDGDTAARYSYINTLRALGQNTTLAEPMLATWHELILAEALPFEDTFLVLDTMRKNYKTGILTNGFITLQRGKIERHHLTDHVDFVLISEEVGYHKPDRRIFLEALRLAGGVSPEQTVYVGDNLRTDIEGARQAGLIPVLVNPDDDVIPPPGVVKIRQLNELLKLFPGG